MNILSGEKAEAELRGLVVGNQVLGLAPYPPVDTRHALPQLLAVAGKGGAVVVDAAATPQLWPLLCRDRPLAAWSAKALVRGLLKKAAPTPRRWADLAVMEGLLRAGRRAFASPTDLAAAHKLLPPPDTMGEVQDLASMAKFCRETALCQGRALERDQMAQTSRLEAAVTEPLAHLEHNGMPLDAARWQARVVYETAEKDRLAHKLSGVLGIPAQALTGTPQALVAALHKGGHPTAGMELQALEAGLQVAEPKKVAAALLQHQALQRLLRSHGTEFLQHLHGGNTRVHPTFVQLGAQTGRLACQAPNLQAIPKAHGRRSCFRPHPSRSLVMADYAACELRILAEVSQDKAYLEAFARGDDVHAQVARAVFGKEVSRTVRPKLREAAKTLSFGLVYGMQVAGLAALLGASQAAAQDLFDRFFATYPAIRAYLEDSEATALTRGWAETLSGRRLYLPTPGEGSSLGHVSRLARNMPIQGTGADMMKLALTLVQRTLEAELPEARVVHCVHDALVVECPNEAVAAAEKVVAEGMRQAGASLLRQVRCSVDTEVAQHWT